MDSSSPKAVAVQQRSFVEVDKPPSPLLLGAVLLIVGAIGFSPWVIVKMSREEPPVQKTVGENMSQPENWRVDAKWHHSHLMQNNLNYITQARMGAQLQRERKFVKSIATYTRLIDESTINKALNYTKRGDAYLMIGRFDLAVSDYSNAIGIDPLEVEAYRGRSEAYKHLGKADLAQTDMAHAMQIFH